MSKKMMWPTMPRKDFRRIGRYVRTCANTLMLHDWTIVLVHEALPADDDAHACVECTYGRKHLAITLGYNFLKQSPEEQRHIIVHELLHVHFNDVELPLREGEAAWNLLGRPAAYVLFHQVRHAVERGVDGIADAVATSFPLP